MTILGVAGRKRSGKDTTAAALVALGWTRIAFADQLKLLTAAFLGLPVDFVKSDAFKDFPVFLREPHVLDLGRPLPPLPPGTITGRDVLQRFGVAAREVFGPDFWVERLFADLKQQQVAADHSYTVAGPFQKIVSAAGVGQCGYLREWGGECCLPESAHIDVVIPDVRFWSEVQAIKNAGGLLVRLNRADRQWQHDWTEKNGHPTSRCCYIHPSIGDEKFHTTDAVFCGLPRRSHPTHWTGDTHVSEVELPDAGSVYDFVVQAESGESAAQMVVDWLKLRR